MKPLIFGPLSKHETRAVKLNSTVVRGAFFSHSLVFARFCNKLAHFPMMAGYLVWILVAVTPLHMSCLAEPNVDQLPSHTQIEAKDVIFPSPRGLYELRYPALFSAQPKQLLRGADLLLRFESNSALPSSYPSFNIISQAGPYNASSRPVVDQAQDVLSSYRQIGISDASITNSTLVTVSGQSTLLVELSYQHTGTELHSSVYTVSGSAAHFILTYIDLASHYASRIDLRDRLVSGFQLRGHETVRQGSPDRDISYEMVHIVAFVVGIATMASIVLFLYRRFFRKYLL